jgi:hypothetical protein
MINHALLISLLILLFNFTIDAQEKNLALGIIVGEPSGLNIKYFIDDQNALEVGSGYSLIRNLDRYYVYMAWLIRFNANDQNKYFPVYLGLGIRSTFKSKSPLKEFGIRGTLGVTMFTETNIQEMFFEFAPVLKVVSVLNLSYDIYLGYRYYIY